MGSNRLLAAGIAALALALGATGCTSADEPDPTPTNSASPAESASTTPSPTASPSQVAQETAEEFIRRWPIFEHQMLVTGDTAEYRALTKGCDACKRLADQVEGFYAAGGYVKVSPQRIQSLKTVRLSEQRAVFIVSATSGPTRYRESSDSSEERLPGGPARFQFTLRKAQQGWVLIESVGLTG
ncbi:MAG: hypothetical protein WAW88_06065 [Nocardioides sp.]